jgi:hypothetical protein
MKSRLLRMVAALVLMSIAAVDVSAQAVSQTTAFTYQGLLNAGGTLPTGLYQFTFTLYNASSGGSPVVGAPSISRSIQVINGLFTTDLDFGQIFSGTQSWLEVKVGTTTLNEETLAARQQIDAVPVAQYALNYPPNDFGDFFALMPPDNAATVAVGAAVSFPQDGPNSGTGVITRVSDSEFQLSSIGTYQVMFQVSVSETGQLVLDLNDIDLPYTVVGRATGTSQIVGMSLVSTTEANSQLSVHNPAGSFVAMTITPLAGGTRPVSAHLVITRLH